MSDHAERHGRRARPSAPCPLGATWDGRDVNFALFSEQRESSNVSITQTHVSPGGRTFRLGDRSIEFFLEVGDCGHG